MSTSAIEKNFKEAQQLLEMFINDPKSLPAIEDAGKLLVQPFRMHLIFPVLPMIMVMRKFSPGMFRDSEIKVMCCWPLAPVVIP